MINAADEQELGKGTKVNLQPRARNYKTQDEIQH